MVILGFSGKCTAGKTTAAEYIKKNYCNVKQYSLANAMKHNIMKDFDLTEEQVYKEKDKRIVIAGKERSPRELMISIGNFYRTLDSDFWVRKVWKQILKQAVLNDLVIIDDIRYPNEINFFTNHAPSLFIRIERPGTPLLDNISETSLDKFDNFYGLIDNDKTKKDLYNSVDTYMERVLTSFPGLAVAKYSGAER